MNKIKDINNIIVYHDDIQLLKIHLKIIKKLI